MSAVEEIKQARALRLTVAERAELSAWLAEFDDEWDRQIEADALAGKLDALWAEADADIEAGNAIPMDEFLRHHRVPSGA